MLKKLPDWAVLILKLLGLVVWPAFLLIRAAFRLSQMTPILQPWSGLLLAVFGGLPVVLFLWVLRKYMLLPKDPEIPWSGRPVPPWLMGVFERALFWAALAIGIHKEAVIAAMGAWLALKMLTHWNRAGYPASEEARQAELKFIRRVRQAEAALLAGVISLGFALIGGLISVGKLHW